MIINKDICNEIHDEYIDGNKIVDESNTDNDMKIKEYFHSEESKISVNCSLNSLKLAYWLLKY